MSVIRQVLENREDAFLESLGIGLSVRGLASRLTGSELFPFSKPSFTTLRL